MNIEPLGELTSNSSISDWWVSNEVNVNYFPDTPLRFILQGLVSDPFPAEFTAAVSSFLGLTLQNRDEATACVFNNYCDFVDAVGEDELDFVIDEPTDVWSHVHASEIHVLRRASGDKKVYVQICANCDWEEEHGLQIVYREGRQLSRVSDQDGHVTHSSAYGLPESEDRIC